MKKAIAVVAGVAGVGTGGYLLLAWNQGWWPFPQKIGTRMVVTASPPSSASAGEEFTFAGYLEDEEGNRLAGGTADLYVDGIFMSSAPIAHEVGWVFSVSIPTTGPHTIYAKFPGDQTYAGC